jgi:uncharacterized membrane protein
MSNIKKSLTSVTAAIIAAMLFTVLGIWQFYMFITFTNAQGTMSMQGGTHHLWLAIGATLVACIAGFFVFSVFLRHDTDDELHITS